LANPIKERNVLAIGILVIVLLIILILYFVRRV
jgi:hypothetical protein